MLFYIVFDIILRHLESHLTSSSPFVAV